MNTELLLRVKAQILKDPKHFDMSDWEEKTDCGTCRCISGWAVALSGNSSLEPNQGHIPLELSGDDQRERLFFNDNWPHKFQQAYGEGIYASDRAQAAADRIDHFIATEGAE